MLLGEFKRDEGVWDDLVRQRLGLRVKESHVGSVHRVQHVLGSRDELSGLGIDLDDQVEKLQVEGEVLDVVGEADDAND